MPGPASPSGAQGELSTSAGNDFFSASDAYNTAVTAESTVNGKLNKERLIELGKGINVPPKIQQLKDAMDAAFEKFNKTVPQESPPASGQGGRKSRKRKTKHRRKHRKSRR
jgi:hypothetical protein